MYTSDIRGNTTNSYNPLASKQKQPLVGVKEKNPNQNNDSLLEVSSSQENNLIKESINNISHLNNYKAFLNVVKSKLEILDTSIKEIKHTQDDAKINQVIKNTLNSTYNGETVFNKQINFAIDETQDLYINTNIKKPNIEDISSLNELQTDTQNILKKINDIEMITNSKVDKEVDSLTYVEVKEKQETEQKRIDDITHQTQDFKNISDSALIQKELLWLLR